MKPKYSENAYIKNFRSGLKPERHYTVSEWADEFRYLSTESSAEAGKWRTDRTPYLKEIMDALSVDSGYQIVTFMKGSQVGGSEAGNNWMGYVMHHSPAPIMAVQPTLSLAKRFSKQRIEPLIQGSPVLAAKIGSASKKESENTILEKKFPGGILILTGANSSAGLRSMPARFIFFDEIDDYPRDVDGQGDPVDLAKARSRTFAKRKWFLNSTPTIEGQSPIAESYELSDKRRCYLPCPGCGEYQPLDFGNLRWDTKITEDGKESASNVHYLCDHCGYKIQNWQKTKMLANHKWIAEDPGASGGIHAGFHLSSLYSPVGWYSWEQIADDFLKAKGNPEKLKTFINTVLGETWKEKSDTPGWQRLYERRENYEMGKIPQAVCFLTAGVDVQADRLEVEVVGWCKNKVSYSIDYQVFGGDTSGQEPWDKLRQLIFTTYPLVDRPQSQMGIKMVAIDSGYKTQTVYDFVRSMESPRVIAVKGQDELNLVVGVPRKADVTIKGKVIRRGLKVWPVGSSLCKIELYGWLAQPKAIDGEPDSFGYCHFPQYDAEYFKMLTAEKLVTKIVKGYKKREWVKERERNEALDCRVYARAAASLVGMDRFHDEHWEKMRTSLTGIKEKASK